MYTKIIAACSEVHNNHTNVLFRPKVELMSNKPDVTLK